MDRMNDPIDSRCCCLQASIVNTRLPSLASLTAGIIDGTKFDIGGDCR